MKVAERFKYGYLGSDLQRLDAIEGERSFYENGVYGRGEGRWVLDTDGASRRLHFTSKRPIEKAEAEMDLELFLRRKFGNLG